MLKRPITEVLSDSVDANVQQCICIGAVDGINGAKESAELAKRHKEVFFSVGIHPHDAGSAKLEEVIELAADPKCVAIGETGLDYFREWSPFDEQKKLFEQTLQVAQELKKPVIIHCRDAAENVLSTLKLFPDLRGVVHCYSEDLEFAKKLADINFLISVTGVVTFKKATGLQEVIRKIGLEQLMLETDAPYMAPEPYRGKECEPKHVFNIAQFVASLRNTSIEEVAEQTTKNAQLLFGLV